MIQMLREAVTLLHSPRGEKSTTLQLRLFAFFALFVFVLALTFYIILLVGGVFDAGEKEGRLWMQNELAHLKSQAVDEFSGLMLRADDLAADIADGADAYLDSNDIAASGLTEKPELIEGVLDDSFDRLLSFIRNNRCSGVFVMLEAGLSGDGGDDDRRSGIFLKRTEPSAVDRLNARVRCLRGPASLAREHSIELLGQWHMEFSGQDAAVLAPVIEGARDNAALPLSRLYRWSRRSVLSGNSEPGILLGVPLMDGEGSVFGVCGLEISSMLYKLDYSPDNSLYPRIFSAFAPLEGGRLDTDAGLIAGNSYLTSQASGSFELADSAGSGLTTFTSVSGERYIGLYETVKLYPDGSLCDGRDWAIALLAPESDWNAAVRGNNLAVAAALLGLVFLSLLLAVFISRHYISPVVAALDALRSDGSSAVGRTNIVEIDDLLEYLSSQDDRMEAMAAELERTRSRVASSDSSGEGPNLSAYQQFVKSIDTLSAAERAVFNLYMEGYTAKEISGILYLSINTIKTHNKRIYMKLGVTSRKELMVYVQMMASEKGSAADTAAPGRR